MNLNHCLATVMLFVKDSEKAESKETIKEGAKDLDTGSAKPGRNRGVLT